MGPLNGIKVVELAGLGPCPAAGMILADFGAEVILIERKTANPNAGIDLDSNKDASCFKRGKKSIALDLKNPDDVETVLKLVEQSDVLIEGFRPGITEKLGLGPEVCHQRNPKLVYGRMTGWGQTGPLAKNAGHDINYVSITGALHYGGLPDDAPYPTPTLVGDIGGGTLPLVIGITSALLYAQNTGQGQVIDAAICDGTIYSMGLLTSIRAQGLLREEKGQDFFGAGSHWCNTYQCADGKYVSVQALEPNFYKELVTLCGFADDDDFAQQNNKKLWPQARAKMAAFFASKTQAQCNDILEGTDACYAPVLSIPEAAEHEHIKARGCYTGEGQYLQPTPAPKFSVSQPCIGEIPNVGQHTAEILNSLNK